MTKRKTFQTGRFLHEPFIFFSWKKVVKISYSLSGKTVKISVCSEKRYLAGIVSFVYLCPRRAFPFGYNNNKTIIATYRAFTVCRALYLKALTHWKSLWCWEGLGAGGEDDRGWDRWMASPTQWTWVWVNSQGWWWTGRPGVRQFMGSQRVGHDWAIELNWTELNWYLKALLFSCFISITYLWDRYHFREGKAESQRS